MTDTLAPALAHGYNFEGKLALVTGAGRGIGWAVAQSLAAAGAHVLLLAQIGRAHV